MLRLLRRSARKLQNAATAQSHTEQLVPGNNIPVSEFIQRRKNVMLSIFLSDQDLEVDKDVIPKSFQANPELPTKYVSLVTGNTLSYMQNDIPNIFRQNPGFRYLSGFLEKDAILLMETTTGSEIKSILFVRNQPDYLLDFEGPSYGNKSLGYFDQIPEWFGVDEVQYLDDFNDYIDKTYVKNVQGGVNEKGVRYGENRKINFFFNQALQDNTYLVSRYIKPFYNDLRTGKNADFVKFSEMDKFIDNHRVIKSQNEMDLIAGACEMSGQAINMVSQQLSNLTNESQVKAALEFAVSNIAGPGYVLDNSYPPVVAASNRSTILHYTENNQFFDLSKDGKKEHVLIDFGVTNCGYNSDITRVFGFNNESIYKVYKALYNCQTSLIEAVRLAMAKTSGKKEKMSLQDLDRLYQFLLVKELVQLGFKSDSKFLISLIGELCPHSVCHHIGLDVHDCTSYDKNVQLQKGMCFVIEPGIYFKNSIEGIPEEYKGIGLRIEDVIVIDHEGNVHVASGNCVKDPEVLSKI